MKKIYLDYNATTQVAPSVFDAMKPFFSEHYGNPSSAHAFGRAAAEAIEDARSKVELMLGCDASEVIFTASGTESNNLAIKGTMFQSGPNLGGHMIISAIEHPAVTMPAKFLERFGFDLTIVDCDSNGVVDPQAVEAALRPETKLVSIMHSNNEIGTLQPIREIAAICRPRNVLVHTDASQSCGKVPLDVSALDVDMLTIAGHKFYAPKGVGALYVRKGVVLEPFLHGAAHERGMRAGTENAAGIVGLGVAAKMAAGAVDQSQLKLGELRDKLLDNLRSQVDGLVVHGESVDRLPNTLSVSFPGVAGHDILSRAPEICASTGSACHSDSSDSSTLKAMGVATDVIRGTMRLSIGWHTNQEEIERASSLLIDAWENLHQPA